MIKVLFLITCLPVFQCTCAQLENINFTNWLAKWQVFPTDAVQAEPISSGVRLKAVKVVDFGDGAIVQSLINQSDNKYMTISADVVSSIGGIGYLQVKIYRNRKETKRYSTDASSAEGWRQRCDFPVSKGDRIEICLRIKLTPKYLNHSAEFRNLKIEPFIRDLLEITPLYHSTSYYYDIPEGHEPENIQIAYRQTGSLKWQEALTPYWSHADRRLRGSIINLSENTKYELRLQYHGIKPVIRHFKTWADKVPTGRHVNLSQSATDKTIKIRTKGTPNAYVRYTAPANTVITADDSGPVLDIRDAAAVAIPNFADTEQDTGCSPKGANFPERPGLKFQINTIRIDLSPNFEPANITITATEDTFFKIIKNEAFNWFTVEPQAGNLKQGETLSLKINPLPEKIHQSGSHPGAFAIRQLNGWSRPVLVYLNSPLEEPIPATVNPAVEIREDRTTALKRKNWDINIPTKDTYYLVIRLKGFNGKQTSLKVRLAITPGALPPEAKIFILIRLPKPRRWRFWLNRSHCDFLPGNTSSLSTQTLKFNWNGSL